MQIQRTCSLSECERRPYGADAYCRYHFARLLKYGSPGALPEASRRRAPFSSRERFYTRVEKQPYGCWEWTGPRNPPGYGICTALDAQTGRSRPQGAHRISYELSRREPVPPNMMVLHRCDNPPCVRPSHLFLGDGRDNVRDMVKKGRNRNLKHRGMSRTHPLPRPNPAFSGERVN